MGSKIRIATLLVGLALIFVVGAGAVDTDSVVGNSYNVTVIFSTGGSIQSTFNFGADGSTFSLDGAHFGQYRDLGSGRFIGTFLFNDWEKHVFFGKEEGGQIRGIGIAFGDDSIVDYQWVFGGPVAASADVGGNAKQGPGTFRGAR